MKVAGAIALLAYACVVAAARSFTWPALVLTAIPGIAIVVLATRRSANRPREHGPRRGLGLWQALATAVLAWELLEFFQAPRGDHPTISSTISSILDVADAHRPLRAALFVGWIALGRELVRR